MCLGPFVTLEMRFVTLSIAMDMCYVTWDAGQPGWATDNVIYGNHDNRAVDYSDTVGMGLVHAEMERLVVSGPIVRMMAGVRSCMYVLQTFTLPPPLSQ